MKKQSILLILSLLLSTAGANAANIKNYEDYTGKRTYSITDTKSSSIFNLNNHYKITTIFNSIYEKDSTVAVKNFTLQYYTDQDDIIAIRPSIKFTIDGKKWELLSSSYSFVNGDGVAQFSWILPEAIIKSLMETKKDISAKFFYNTPEGDRFKEYTIPYKIIALVQKMYLQKIEPVNSVLAE